MSHCSLDLPSKSSFGKLGLAKMLLSILKKVNRASSNPKDSPEYRMLLQYPGWYPNPSQYSIKFGKYSVESNIQNRNRNRSFEAVDLPMSNTVLTESLRNSAELYPTLICLFSLYLANITIYATLLLLHLNTQTYKLEFCYNHQVWFISKQGEGIWILGAF